MENITTDPDTDVYPIKFEVDEVTGYGTPIEEDITLN